MNPNLTVNIVEKYPYKPWNLWNMSKNPNITMKIIENI